jgi:antitoxin component of RelBE/YafQ-DinJ toxin-antitoxin module
MTSTTVNKVTVGFKCHGDLKFQLAQEAHGMGLTVSEYLEMLISQRSSIHGKQNDALLQQMEQKLSFYENSELKEYYRQSKGKTVSFRDEHGVTRKKTINSLQETYEIILQLAKTAKI